MCWKQHIVHYYKIYYQPSFCNKKIYIKKKKTQYYLFVIDNMNSNYVKIYFQIFNTFRVENSVNRQNSENGLKIEEINLL